MKKALQNYVYILYSVYDLTLLGIRWFYRQDRIWRREEVEKWSMKQLIGAAIFFSIIVGVFISLIIYLGYIFIAENY